MNIKRENIKFVDVIVRKITFHLEDANGLCRVSYTYETPNKALQNMMSFIKQYDLKSVPESNGRQYVLR